MTVMVNTDYNLTINMFKKLCNYIGMSFYPPPEL